MYAIRLARRVLGEIDGQEPGYYEHYGIVDPGLAQQDITTKLVMECLADSVGAVS